MLPRFASFRWTLTFSCNSVLNSNLKFLPKTVTNCFNHYEIHSGCFYHHSFGLDNSSLFKKTLDQLNYCIINSREKSTKNRRSAEYESGSDSDDEVESIPGSKLVQIQTESLRCDMILKLGLGIARNKLEVLFYEGRIRVNGEKIQKKNQDVQLGDELDLIRGVSEDNPDFINISRVEVLKARPTGDIIILTIRKYKLLLIENYEKHPWIEGASEKPEEK